LDIDINYVGPGELEAMQAARPGVRSGHGSRRELLYSHQSIDPSTRQPRFKSNRKRMLLACGKLDQVLFNDICGATQRTAPHMTTTPGEALFLEQTGHSVDNERRVFWAVQIARFLRL
jgi:hypothetical protein